MPESETKLSKIQGFLEPYQTRLVLLVILTILLSVFTMLPPLLVRAIIDKVVTQRQASLLLPLSLGLIGLRVIGPLCRYWQTVGIAQLGQRFVFDVRMGLFDHLMRLSLRFFGKNSVGMVVNRLMGDSGLVQQMLTSQSIGIVSDMVCAGFAISATFLINWRLAVLLLVIVITFVVNYRINIKRIRRATRGSRKALDRLSGGVQNRLVANLAVKTFGTETREQEVFREQSESTLALGKEAQLASNTFSMNTQLIQGLGRSVIYFLGCAMVLRGSLTYGDVVAFTSYAVQLLAPAVRFSELVRQLQTVAIAMERLFDVFSEAPEIRDAEEPAPVGRLTGQVDFEDVCFEYEEGNPVICDLDVHISAGESVALIGPTGCGKSTILSLLLRFYDVSSGKLLLDGIDIRQISLKSLRRQFGIVLQEPLLFSVSIADNIRYSRPGATQAEIEEAARVAEIHDFILSLPDGYESRIGSEGVELSVGQKQRITIARAVVANPAILIMDEATSALDSNSELAIQTAMERVLKGRTSFIVAHRLSTIRNADRIILLREGRIAEMGNHEQLMALPDGQYHDLYLKHMGAGVLEEQ